MDKKSNVDTDVETFVEEQIAKLDDEKNENSEKTIDKPAVPLDPKVKKMKEVEIGISKKEGEEEDFRTDDKEIKLVKNIGAAEKRNLITCILKTVTTAASSIVSRLVCPASIRGRRVNIKSSADLNPF